MITLLDFVNPVTWVTKINDVTLTFNFVTLFIITAIGVAFSVLFFMQKSYPYGGIGIAVVSCTILLYITFIFSYSFTTYIAFLLILGTLVIYGHDIRDLVAHLSSRHSQKHRELVLNLEINMIDALCQACIDLSRNRTGALIVIERNIKLDDIARSGIEIDAKVNPYLIRNIFFDKAPLHDGAVLIRNCRVWAASCILPLTNSNKVDKDLGTRHRAGMGISEISDAITIVVSEETGIISVAYKSKIIRDFNFRTLHAYLTENLLDRKDEEKA